VPAERRLVIDIGTNSTLALLARIEGSNLEVISDKKATTRLGEGSMSTGRLTQEAMRRTAAAVARSVRELEWDKAYLLGTEALRLAANSGDFIEILRLETGLALNIISGSKEAELSFLGAMYNLDLSNDNIILIDVGGGSTELVAASNEKILDSKSIPIGALKLLESLPDDTEDHYGYYTGRGIDYLMNPQAELQSLENAAIIATGGTITSAAAVIAGLKEYDPTRLNGICLTRDQLSGLAHKFEHAEPAQRQELIPFDPDRAELILPGLGIFLAFLSIIERDSLFVSTGGLRFGAALYPEKIQS